jgi:hypothetical protein
MTVGQHLFGYAPFLEQAVKQQRCGTPQDQAPRSGAGESSAAEVWGL